MLWKNIGRDEATKLLRKEYKMAKKTDALERIADALDGGGDYHQGKPDEVGYLNRIANALEAGSGGGSGANANSNTIYVVPGDYANEDELSEEDYSRLVETIYDNGGIAVISATGDTGLPAFIGNKFGFWNCLGDELRIDDDTHVVTIIPAGN